MLRQVKLLGVCVAMLYGGFNAEAQGGFILFTSRAAFEAATGGVLTFDSYEDVFAKSDSINRPGYDFNETGGSPNQFLDMTQAQYAAFGMGAAVTDGNRAASFVNDANSLITFNFDTPINAFGFDLTTRNTSQLVNFGGDVSGSFTTNSGSAPTFFGIINKDGPINTLTFDVGGTGTVIFDSTLHGTSDLSLIPEPSNFILLGMGVLCGGFMFYGANRRRLAMDV